MKKEAEAHTLDCVEKKEETVSDEESITIYINGLRFISIFATPKDLKQLAIGFVLTEGVASQDDIGNVDVNGLNAMIEVRGKKDLNLLMELRSSGCSGVMQKGVKPVKSNASFSKETIFESLKSLDESSLEFKTTGGTHTAYLMGKDGKALALFEDVGRHNALDKVVGWSYLEKVGLEDKFLLFSGRLSAGIVNKVARAGIPMIVSKAAPLSQGIKNAQKLNLTLVGFARYPRFNAYTHSERIK